MSDLQDAIRHALDGNAILFTGAGFSAAARNLDGEPLKTGAQLAEYLASKIGLPPDTALGDAAEEFIEAHGIAGPEVLISELQRQYQVKELDQSHLVIARVPWRRIYTTNYDNVIERAFAECGRPIKPFVISDGVQSTSSTTTACVHLNGYVDRLTRASLQTELKLTDSSYVTSSVAESTWAMVFRDDLQVARAVFFVGYSLMDLDIARLVSESASLKEKTFFILGSDPTKATERRANRFGTLLPLDSQSFAALIEEVSLGYSPREASSFYGHCIRKESLAGIPSLEISYDSYVFSLFRDGRFEPALLPSSVHDRDQKYYLQRREIGEIVAALTQDNSVIVHSNLANGKSLLVEGIKHECVKRQLNVFTFTSHTGEPLREFQRVLRSHEDGIFIVENYPDWLDFLGTAGYHVSPNFRFLFTARSGANDANIERLARAFPAMELLEYNVDKLSDDELNWLSDMLRDYGLWGERAGWSERRKLRFLRKDCHRQFQYILVHLFEAPQIADRFERLLDQLSTRNRDYHILTSLLVLAVLQHPATVNTLVDIWGDRVLQSSFRGNQIVRELVDFETGEIRLRSSASGRFVLKQVANANWTVDTLVMMQQKANQARRVSNSWNVLFKKLMRFSELQYLLPDPAKRSGLIRYYESIKNLSGCKNNPLFWLQYAISCLVLDELSRARTYFDTAYALAYSTSDFDPYQIDNHYARFLLLSAIESHDPETCMEPFRQARQTIEQQTESDQRFNYPFRVAQLYFRFWDIFKNSLPIEDINEIRRAAESISLRIERLPRRRQQHPDVRRCYGNMKLILADTVDGIASSDTGEAT